MKPDRYGWRRKQGGSRSANAYSLTPALLALMITAGAAAFLCARMDAWIWLQRAQQKSTWELSVIDQAKAYWHQAQIDRLCHSRSPEPVRSVEVMDQTATMEWSSTAIRCSGTYGVLVLYMDGTGITAAEWEEKIP